MTTNLREFKIGDVIQDKKQKRKIFIVGEIIQIERLNLYELDDYITHPVKVIKGSPMIKKYQYYGEKEEEICDFQLVDASIVEKHYLNEGEETEKFRKKLEELKKIQPKE